MVRHRGELGKLVVGDNEKGLLEILQIGRHSILGYTTSVMYENQKLKFCA